MGDQPVKKQHTDSSSGRDIISNLPHPIKENILAHMLYTEEALRTSVLSKDWRYAWCTIPKLIVCEKRVDEDPDYDCHGYVNMLLSNHKGPLKVFGLHMDDPGSEDLDRWIHVLGSKGVKDLAFSFDSTVDDHDIPPSFFNCLLDLTDLKLEDCTLNMPLVFDGFKLLQNVELFLVRCIGGGVEKLVSSCPLLEDLKLIDEVESLGNLVIRSQSLKKLTVLSEYNHLLIEAPKLFAFHISPRGFRDAHLSINRVDGEFETFSNGRLDQDNCCNFTLCYYINATVRELHVQLDHLIEMFICIDLSNEGDHAAALCLFTIAPRLQDLYVKFNSGDGTICSNFWKSENGDDLFSSLKTVTIGSNNSGGAAFILEFVEFVLRTAPVLERMAIINIGFTTVMYCMKNPSFLRKVSHEDCSVKEMRADLMTILEVLKFPRLSNKATVELI